MKTNFSDKEIDEIIKSMVIVQDTREQQAIHITNFFDKNKIKYVVKKLNSGDYSFYIPKNENLGISRNLYADLVIERKNSIDELAGSFKDRNRFESEFIRTIKTETKIVLLVEDGQGYGNLLKGNYRSEYSAKALLASLKSWENRYNFNTIFLDKEFSGNFIYYTLRYYLYEYLKN